MWTPKRLADLGADRVAGHRRQPERRGEAEGRPCRRTSGTRRSAGASRRRASRRRASASEKRAGRGRRSAPCCSETRARSARRGGRCCSRGRASSARRALTTGWPSRAPRPHFTIARATRNATTISRIVPLAKPAYAFAGGRKPERTEMATARTDAVRIGNALTMTDDDRRREDREQLPCLQRQARRARARTRSRRRGPRPPSARDDASSCPGHGFASRRAPSRIRPRRSTARPLDARRSPRRRRTARRSVKSPSSPA